MILKYLWLRICYPGNKPWHHKLTCWTELWAAAGQRRKESHTYLFLTTTAEITPPKIKSRKWHRRKYNDSRWLQVKQRTSQIFTSYGIPFRRSALTDFFFFLPRSPIKNLQINDLGGHLCLGTVQRRNWGIWAGAWKVDVREIGGCGSQPARPGAL